MDLKNIKKIVKEWIKWSAEKQLKIFTKNTKNKKFFKKALEGWKK